MKQLIFILFYLIGAIVAPDPAGLKVKKPRRQIYIIMDRESSCIPNACMCSGCSKSTAIRLGDKRTEALIAKLRGLPLRQSVKHTEPAAPLADHEELLQPYIPPSPAVIGEQNPQIRPESQPIQQQEATISSQQNVQQQEAIASPQQYDQKSYDSYQQGHQLGTRASTSSSPDYQQAISL